MSESAVGVNVAATRQNGTAMFAGKSDAGFSIVDGATTDSADVIVT
jgi:hypothetical protein